MARTGGGALALVALLAAASCSREVEAPPLEGARTPAPTAADLAYGRLRVEVGVEGGMERGSPWTMYVDPSAQAAVFLGPRLDAKRMARKAEVHTFDLGSEGRKRLREMLIEERFFELESVYGRPASDHGDVFIEVRIGGHFHRVEILYTHPDEIRSGRVAGTLEGLERAWRIFDAVTEPIEGDWAAARTRTFMELTGQQER